MIKNVEMNVETNEINMIFHDEVPADYETLPGFEIVEKECEQLPDGGWRVVGWVPPMTQEEKLNKLEQENKLLKAQNQALTEKTDFHEELIAEMAMLVYS